MLFGEIKTALAHGSLNKGVLDALAYACTHDLAAMPLGQHPINGDALFVNIVEYTTTTPENRFWEAHREYLDVHVPIAGTEQIDLNFIGQMDLRPYQPEGDFLPMEGEKAASVIMTQGTYLVCDPADAHRTAVAAGHPEVVRKAIFKVKI